MYLWQMLIFNALSGQLTYDSADISVYDEKRRIGTKDKVFVVLSSQQETPYDETDTDFTTLSSIDIEIFHKTDFEVSKAALGDLTNQILGIIIPNPWQNGTGVPDHFAILNVRRERAITRNFQITDSESILSKIITISAQIVQQSP